jgi:DNA-directed RNA polymerase specialized sigma24 family protein
MNPVPSSEPTVSVLNRESEWFMQEVQPHAGKLKSYLQSSFPSVRDVDDVVQESFLQIWRVRAARPITSARGLLFIIARNVALNLAQRQRSAPVCTVADSPGCPLRTSKPMRTSR